MEVTTVHTKHLLIIALVAVAVLSASLYAFSSLRAAAPNSFVDRAGKSLIQVSLGTVPAQPIATGTQAQAATEQSHTQPIHDALLQTGPRVVGLGFVGDGIR